MATCGECEFFGNYAVMQHSPEWASKEVADGVLGYYHPFIGFDEKQGAHCDYDKDAWHKRIRIYDGTPACGQFQPRTWCRPDSCHNCSLCHGRMSDGSFLCSGWPFYKKEGDEPCQNGRGKLGEQLKLF